MCGVHDSGHVIYLWLLRQLFSSTCGSFGTMPCFLCAPAGLFGAAHCPVLLTKGGSRYMIMVWEIRHVRSRWRPARYGKAGTGRGCCGRCGHSCGMRKEHHFCVPSYASPSEERH
jgi:hypothetical protein